MASGSLITFSIFPQYSSTVSPSNSLYNSSFTAVHLVENTSAFSTSSNFPCSSVLICKGNKTADVL
ncbi:hypothetical protein BOQ62_10300 [Chryseobacterium sp. CH21]|nr:hypothetical protein BOQ62_10300 [Chryseobacterium sp. CH21]